MSDKSRAILTLIAGGRSYDQILTSVQDCTYLDIFNAAAEALGLETSESDAVTWTEETLSKALPERELVIMRARLGLVDGKRHTLDEIGQQLGISRERVRQLEGRAQRRLRRFNASGTLRQPANRETAPWVVEARKVYPRAYEPWTDAEDVRLTDLFESGTPAEEIAATLERGLRAIAARLVRLGLIEKRSDLITGS